MVPAQSDDAQGARLPKLRLGVLHYQGARWYTKGSPALEVDLRCASCGARATVSLSLEEARRCGFDEPE
jgi:hypothetical protein